jgi:radical SAM superfamily enzyme YgiQ (UPF0313 family)
LVYGNEITIRQNRQYAGGFQLLIKLISPRMSLRPMDSEYKRVLSPSLSLLILASLTPKEYDVYIEDENVRPLNLTDSPNLVAITVNVDTSKRAYRIADAYRSRGIPVVLGGIHPSSCPDEALQYASSVCIGEAEGVWQKMLNDTISGKLQPRYYHSEPVDLSVTPLPRWDMLNRSKYLYTNIICATRGCPFRCDFCYNSCEYIHNCHRNRPIDNIIAEIEALGTKQVMFIDDNLIGNIAWTRELIKAMKPLGLTWHAAVSTNIGSHPDLLDEMKSSGCKSLFIGFESINGKSTDSVGKYQNHTGRFDCLIRDIHDRDIMVNASMAFGFDHDYPSVFGQTLKWLVENKVETMTGHILTPYPGTRLYKRLLSEGRITDFDPSHYNTSHVVFRPKNMTAEELQEGYIWIYDQIYSLRNIYRRMPNTLQRKIPYLLFNLGYRKYGKITSIISKLNLMNLTGRLARRLSYGIE